MSFLGEQRGRSVGEEFEDESADAILSVVIATLGGEDGQAVAADPEAHIDGEGEVIFGEVAGDTSEHDILDVFTDFPFAGGVESFGHLVIPVESVAGPRDGIGVDEAAPVAAHTTCHLEEEAEFDFVAAFVAFGLILPNADQTDFVVEIDVKLLPVGAAHIRARTGDDIAFGAATCGGLGGDEPHFKMGTSDDVDVFAGSCGKSSQHWDLLVFDHDVDVGVALNKVSCIASASQVGTKVFGVKGGRAFVPVAVFAEGGFSTIEDGELLFYSHAFAQELAVMGFFLGVLVEAFVFVEDAFEGVVFADGRHQSDVDKQHKQGDRDVYKGEMSGAHLATEQGDKESEAD